MGESDAALQKSKGGGGRPAGPLKHLTHIRTEPEPNHSPQHTGPNKHPSGEKGAEALHVKHRSLGPAARMEALHEARQALTRSERHHMNIRRPPDSGPRLAWPLGGCVMSSSKSRSYSGDYSRLSRGRPGLDSPSRRAPLRLTAWLRVPPNPHPTDLMQPWPSG